MRACWMLLALGVALAATAAPARAGDLALCQRGAMETVLHDFAAAVEDLTRCLETSDPPAEMLAPIHGSRGIAFLALQQFQPAVDDFDKVIELAPNDPVAYFSRGFARGKLGDYQGCVDDLDRAIELNPKNTPAYVIRGVARLHLGDDREAIDDFDRAIEIDPDLSEAYSGRGMAWSHLGEDQKAIGDFDLAIELAPSDAALYLQRAGAWESRGQFWKAIDDYSRAIQLEPDNAIAYNGRAWSRFRLRTDLDVALADTEMAVRLEPDDLHYVDTHAHVLASLGRRQEAMASFERAMTLADRDAITRYQTVLARQGYYGGAIDGVYGAGLRSALEACVRDACDAWSE